MKYDVALSFAGEDRKYVEEVAKELKKMNVRVFYDNFETVNLWGKNLYTHLQNVYQNEAKYTVMFISEHYAKKLWTNHERKMAQSRAFTEAEEYILPARFDDTEIEGIVSTTGYIDLRNYSPQEFSNLIYKKLESEILTFETFQHDAFHDPLTALPNRAYFIKILEKLIEEIKIGNDSNSYILFLDIAHFKNINERLGHNIGDRVLFVLAKRFSRKLSPDSKVARLGGDEFTIILKGLSSDEKAEKAVREIYNYAVKPIALNGNRIFINLNIGITRLTTEYATPEEILRDADIAMRQAKETKINIGFFTKELRENYLDTMNLEANLRLAVERKEISAFYQPIVSLKDGELFGTEASMRWFNQEKGFIPPVKFIPVAESSGLIVPITDLILDNICYQTAKWRETSFAPRDLVGSLNISKEYLFAGDLIENIKMVLQNFKLPSFSLMLEITESVALENIEQAILILSQLKQLGVMLAITNFGTGYSSLTYLYRLPFDILKIDRAFVASIEEDGGNSEFLQALIELARNLKMRVIAEGIETENQLSLLRNLGCDYGQGYLFSAPLPKDKIEDLLYQRYS